MKGNLVWIIFTTMLLYAALVLFSDVSKISDHFSHIRIELVFLMFAVGMLSHVMKIFRQKDLLESVDEKIPLKQNLIIYLAGLSLIFTPGGIGVFIKSHFLKQRFNIENNKSFPVIFLERYHDLFAATTIISIGLWMSFSWISVTLVAISYSLLLVVYLAITNLNVFSFIHDILVKIKFIAKRLPEMSPNKSFFILTRPKAMTKGWLISTAGWGLDSLVVYIGFLSLGVDLGYVLTSQIYLTSLGYGVLSLLPGGIGVTEGVADYLLVQQGLTISFASALVIFTRLVTIWSATGVGLIFTRFASKQKINVS